MAAGQEIPLSRSAQKSTRMVAACRNGKIRAVSRRAQFVSFNFPNNLICTVASSAFRHLSQVQCHGGANERLQRLFINLVALMEIDGTPGVAFEAGVEEA